MTTRKQARHYREQLTDAAIYAAAGVDRSTAPRPVPELLRTTGGYPVIVPDRFPIGGTHRVPLASFRPVLIVEPAPYADVWGDAR